MVTLACKVLFNWVHRLYSRRTAIPYPGIHISDITEFSVRPHAYNARLHLNTLDLIFALSNTPPQKLNLNKCNDIYIIYNLITNITKYKLKLSVPHLSLLSLSLGTYMVQHLLQGLGKHSKT